MFSFFHMCFPSVSPCPLFGLLGRETHFRSKGAECELKTGFFGTCSAPTVRWLGMGCNMMQPLAAASRLSINITFGTSLNPQCQWFHNMKCVEFHLFIGILKSFKTSLFNIRIPKMHHFLTGTPGESGDEAFAAKILVPNMTWKDSLIENKKTPLSRNSNGKFNEGPLQTSYIQIHQKHVNLVQISITCMHFPIAPNNFMRQTIASFLASPFEIPQHRLKT